MTRRARLATALALGLTLLTGLAGCDSQGADTSCGLDSCTVTFDRGVEAQADILGVKAKLVGAQGDQVALGVAGEQVSLTAGQTATEVAGLQVSVQSVDDKQVVVQIAR
jgi:hypothetical protein